MGKSDEHRGRDFAMLVWAVELEAKLSMYLGYIQGQCDDIHFSVLVIITLCRQLSKAQSLRDAKRPCADEAYEYPFRATQSGNYATKYQYQRPVSTLL